MRARAASAAVGIVVLSASSGPPARAATKSVLVGGPARGAPEQTEVNAFLRRLVTVHVGDSVVWRVRGLHTVSLIPKGQKAPDLIAADPTHPVMGANDATNTPFWFNGQPRLIINPKAGFPAGGKKVTGRAYLNSGVPGERPLNYRLTFAKRGTFTFLCIVHPGIEGKVRVVSRKQRVPTTAQDAAATRSERAALVAAAKKKAAEPTTPGTVEVGRTGRSTTRFSIQAFFPSAVTVKANAAVRFTMEGQDRQEVHTVTFVKEAIAQVLEKSIVTQEVNGAPIRVLEPRVFYPSDPPPVVPPHTGTNHGDGFLNAGVLDNVPLTPVPQTATVTFTNPGTYEFHCIIHPGMKGTVTVTE